MPPAPPASVAELDEPPAASPRQDLADAVGWLLLGVAIVVAAASMDRLEHQDVPPFAAPGLLPGLLGIALVLLGGILLGRSLRRGALRNRVTAAAPPQQRGRALLVIVLCVLFGTVLVGHGLPFWAAAALFVTVAILLLRRRPADRQRQVDASGVLTAAVIGLCAGGAITLVFQQVFLVRLP